MSYGSKHRGIFGLKQSSGKKWDIPKTSWEFVDLIPSFLYDI